jgi:hypothetical protein
MSKKKYKNGTKYNKCEHDEEHPYTIMTNNIIRDERLDLLEVGIMTHLLSHDENNYTINTTYIQKISGIGQDRFYKKIKHLTELGYITKIPILGGINWTINESPVQLIEDVTSSENTNRGNTSSENTNRGNTSSENTSRVSPIQRSNNETITNESIKNDSIKNEPIKNESVVGDLDLESVAVQSLASASQLAPSLHTPIEEVQRGNSPKVEEKVFVDNTPIQDLSQSDKANENTTNILVDNSLQIVEELHNPMDDIKSQPIVPDVRFSEQHKLYTTSKYFLKDNLDRVLEIYQYYGNKFPNSFMNIGTFDKVLAYLIVTQLGMINHMNINKCLKTYRNDIEFNLVHVPQLYKEMKENPEDTQKILKEHELKT